MLLPINAPPSSFKSSNAQRNFLLFDPIYLSILGKEFACLAVWQSETKGQLSPFVGSVPRHVLEALWTLPLSGNKTRVMHVKA